MRYLELVTVERYRLTAVQEANTLHMGYMCRDMEEDRSALALGLQKAMSYKAADAVKEDRQTEDWAFDCTPHTFQGKWRTLVGLNNHLLLLKRFY